MQWSRSVRDRKEEGRERETEEERVREREKI